MASKQLSAGSDTTSRRRGSAIRGKLTVLRNRTVENELETLRAEVTERDALEEAK